jgi:hypothetical protein
VPRRSASGGGTPRSGERGRRAADRGLAAEEVVEEGLVQVVARRRGLEERQGGVVVAGAAGGLAEQAGGLGDQRRGRPRGRRRGRRRRRGTAVVVHRTPRAAPVPPSRQASPAARRAVAASPGRARARGADEVGQVQDVDVAGRQPEPVAALGALDDVGPVPARVRDTTTWSAFAGLAGGSSPHSSPTRRSTLRPSRPWRTSSAISVRERSPATGLSCHRTPSRRRS